MGNEYVIRGNSAMLKCDIPSYVADLVHVSAWLDDHGQSYHSTDSLSGKQYRKQNKTALSKTQTSGEGNCFFEIVFLDRPKWPIN